MLRRSSYLLSFGLTSFPSALLLDIQEMTASLATTVESMRTDITAIAENMQSKQLSVSLQYLDNLIYAKS